jgi:hypothetical protein
VVGTKLDTPPDKILQCAKTSASKDLLSCPPGEACVDGDMSVASSNFFIFFGGSGSGDSTFSIFSHDPCWQARMLCST